jgi:hypothetical protein
MSQFTPILDGLIAELNTITPTNGYTTALAGVYRGYEAMALADTVAMPYLTVQSLTEREIETVGPALHLERQVLLLAVFEVAPLLDAALSGLARDVRLALRAFKKQHRALQIVKFSVHDLSFDAPEPGSELATFALTVTVRYVENFPG